MLKIGVSWLICGRMNTVRRRSLGLALACGAVLLAVLLVANLIDKGQLRWAHPEPVLVAFAMPSFLLLIRSSIQVWTGRLIPKGWPYQLHKPFNAPRDRL